MLCSMAAWIAKNGSPQMAMQDPLMELLSLVGCLHMTGVTVHVLCGCRECVWILGGLHMCLACQCLD